MCSRCGVQEIFRSNLVLWVWALVTIVTWVNRSSGAPPETARDIREQQEFFEKEIRPIFLTRCLECHGPADPERGIRVDSRSALLQGDERGPLVVPGEPDQSRLMRAISYEGEIQMPPAARLPEKSIAAIREWVRLGAPWPETSAVVFAGKRDAAHWAFQPVGRPQPPDVTHGDAVRQELDRFVLARLESAGIPFNAPADPRTLVRRLYFDLIGLPPEPEEVDAFVHDNSATALAALVERLLASPHFGERWGRYWLDLARYADTKGYVFEEDRNYKYAYLYRDWVIRAFNDDMPYDQFLIRQLAADQIPGDMNQRNLAAMGFLTLGRRFLNNPHDIIDDRIDVITRTTMGLTVSCARCHDHKYDPIPTEDYYSLYGVLAASHEELLDLEEPSPDYLAELQKRQAAVQEYAQGEAKQGRLNELNRMVAEWMNSDEAPPQILVLRDPAEPPAWPRVFRRGNPQIPGNEVPRRFLKVLSADTRPAFSRGSGRWELAQAIASPGNPLTARVWANRVWGHLMGRHLVETPSDFGARSQPPDHPELLDFLASELTNHAWSTKHLIRQIVMSSTYQRASTYGQEAAELDPENRLWWRANRRRLDLETLRDSLMRVAGTLDLELFGPPVQITEPPFSHRRTIYGHVDRQNLPGLFRTFDFASPDSHSPVRYTTTVPQQALFLMNHPFVWDQAKAMVARADVAALEDSARIERLYRLLFSRGPDAEELTWGVDYLRSIGDHEQDGDSENRASRENSAGISYAQALLMSDEFAFVD